MVATPKQASTVVLVDDQYNVYLTKRPKTMKFMGGFYVFPGGGMDVEDTVIKKELVIGKHKYSHLHISHYITAARELFEEVGILLCTDDDGKPIILDEEKSDSYRHQLLNEQISFNDLLEREHIFLNIDHLNYFGRLITPKGSPIRYDTRFFLAKLPKGQLPKPNRNEIDDAFWISPEKGLHLNKNKKLLLSSPTVAALKSVIAFKNGQKLELQYSQLFQF